MSNEQISINFERGTLDRFPNFMDCVRSAVYGCGKPFKNIAADLDMSPSYLSQCLAPVQEGQKRTVHFPLEKFPDLLKSIGRPEPRWWLDEAAHENPEKRKERLAAQLDRLLPELEGVLGELKKNNVIPMKKE